MKKSHFIVLVVGVVLMAGGPAAGLLVTVQAMKGAVAATQAGTGAERAELADQISEALTGTIVGLGVGAVGLVDVVVAMVAHFVARSRRKAEASRPSLWPPV